MKAKFATSCCVFALLLPPLAAQSADAATAQTGSPTQTVAKDAAMTARIEARLADEKKADLAQVKATADRNGHVVLSGKVKTLAEEERAVSIVRDTEGATLVRSTIQIGQDD